MKALLPAALFTAAFLTPAFAYLDPGTGSIILQAIIGAFAVAGATISVYWQRVRSFFSTKSEDKKK